MDEIEENIRRVNLQIDSLVEEIRLYVRELLRRAIEEEEDDVDGGPLIFLGGIDTLVQTPELENKLARLDELYDLQIIYSRELFRRSTEQEPMGLSESAVEDLAAFVLLSKQAIRDSVQSYASNVGAGILNNSVSIFKSPVEDVLDVAEERIFSRMNTDLKTQVSAYNRVVQYEQARMAGLNSFLYAGPRDERNRPFCAERVNKVFSREQISQWDNGQGLPADIFCGGYNCRHELVPVNVNRGQIQRS